VPGGQAVVDVFTQILRSVVILCFVAWLSVDAAERDELRIAYREDSAPIQYIDRDGEPKGVLIDYWRSWAEEVGVDIVFVGGSNEQTQQWLQEGSVDLIAGLFRNDRRAELFDFSTPVIFGQYFLFYNPALVTINSAEQIPQFSVGVTEKSFHHDWLLTNYPDARILTYPDYEQLFVAFDNNDVSTLITQASYLAHYLNENNLTLSLGVLPDALYFRPYQAAVKKGNRRVLSLLDEGIDLLGDYQKQAISPQWNKYLWVDSEQQDQVDLNLTAEERDWIAAHPVIDMAVEGNWPPVDFTDAQGNQAGILSDYLRIFENRIGIEIKTVRYPNFKEMVTNVQQGINKVGATIVQTDERSENLWFTSPYFGAVKVLVSNIEGETYQSLSELSGKSLAIEDGYFLMDVIQANYPEIILKPFPSTEEALKALSFKQADAYIGNQAVVSWLTQALQLSNLAVTGDPGLAVSLQRFAVYKDEDWRPLVSVLNKTLASITMTERQRILTRWLNNSDQFYLSAPLLLSPEEQRWLDNHSTWKIGADPSLPPLEYIDDAGELAGLSAEVLKLIQFDIGVNTEVLSDSSRAESVQALRNRRVDILPLASPNEVDRADMLYSKPYLKSPYMILVEQDTNYVSGIRDLSEFRVGVVQDYAIEHLLQRDFPDLNVVFFRTAEAALSSLSLGEIDAYIGELNSSTWSLKELGIRNIKIAAQTDYFFEHAIAVRKDWAELVPVLNKAIDRISEAQLSRIQNQWFAVRVEQQVDARKIRQAILITCLILVPILFVSLYWNKKLTQAKNRLALSQQSLAEAKQSAEQANEFKSQFLANMSHEIRTPMNAIVGMTHLLQSTQLNEQQTGYANKITRASISLLSIINDILDFSKIEAGKLDIETTEFELNDVILSLTNLFALKAEEKGIEIIFDVDANIQQKRTGDPLRIEQVLINLIQNAIKFTQKGQVLVRIRSLNSEQEKHLIQFSVMDTGIGIATEQLQRLFLPFTQADTSTTREHGGTGLGLSISRQLVSLMGGELVAESMLGYGSTFSFTLNLAIAENDNTETTLLVCDDLKGLRVLVVDDNETARQINFEMLTSFGLAVDCVESGYQALECVSEHNQGGENPYRLVLIDWKMPGMDGVTATSRIKAMSLHMMPTVILVTAYGREYFQNYPCSDDVDAFLIKPLNSSLLFDCIMKLFQQQVLPQLKMPDQATGQLQGRILLVEDHAINLEVAQAMLNQLGLDVTTACNGQEALTKLAVDRFDLVLMDIQMPVMDGFTATKTLRKIEQFKQLPIIAMTAHAMKDDKQRCLDAGMNDHIAKPIDPAVLQQVLSQWLAVADRSPESGGVKPDRSSDKDAIDGLDESRGVIQVGGNKTLYTRLVAEFYARHQQDLSKIESAVNQNDIDTAHRIAHTMCGVAGNIGASDLSLAAGDLCNSLSDSTELKESPYWRNFYLQFQRLFQALTASKYSRLSGLEADACFNSQPEMAEQSSEAIFTELLDALEWGDPNARNSLAAIKSFLPADQFEKLSEQIHKFEFDNAKKILTQSMHYKIIGGSDV
jgi:polar amino acid transport system substrate-binding protein